MKLLVVCDSPTLNTGFARVAQNLLKRWNDHFERIDIWGIGFNGYPGRPGVAERVPWFRPPFVVYPASYGQTPWFSMERLQSLLNHIMAGDYTHLWLLQDHFLLCQHDFPQYLRDACARKGVKSYAYLPVDAEMDGDWVAIAEAVDCPVAYTLNGVEEIRRHTGRLERPGREFPFPEIRILPHGVDCEIYRPLPNRAELRESVFPGLMPTDTLLLNVNANQRRKDPVRSLETLRELHQRNLTHYKLLLHMAESGADDLSLEAAGRQLGLVRGRDWDHTGSTFVNGLATLPEEKLVELYSAADVYLSTSLGEGWGLGITEALACGCPVAVPEHTACAEILSEVSAHGMEARVTRLPLEPHAVMLPYDNARLRRRVDVAGAATAIQAACGSAPFLQQRPPLVPDVQRWLSWNRIALAWVSLFRSVDKESAHHYLEYGGGLGDVFNGLYHRGSYNVLRDLKPNETATVALRCHNPHARELFEAHPKRAQFNLLDLGYTDPEPRLDAAARREFALPRAGALDRVPAKDSRITFYPLKQDRPVLAELAEVLASTHAVNVPPRYVLLSASAGLPDRNLPAAMIEDILRALCPTNLILLVGRTYARQAREEINVHGLADQIGLGSRVVNLVDKLSVPATATLVQRAAGLVTCHSSLNLLAWHNAVPQLLLYPESVWRRHIQRKDQWSFGIDDGRTVHARFDEWDARRADLIQQFSDLLRRA